MTAVIEKNGDQVNGVPQPGLAGGRRILFDQAIARQLMRTTSASEVFVTDVRDTGPDTFEIRAQWPSMPGFFGPDAMFGETIRQAVEVIGHQALDVPSSHRLLIRDTSWTIDPAGPPIEGAPVDVVLTATAQDLRYRGKHLGDIRLGFACERAGRRIGSASVSLNCASPSSYRELRGCYAEATPYQAALLPTVEPATVGRDKAEDVVLAETPLYNVWSLQADPAHPVMFPRGVHRPVDHVPSLVLMEGARQAGLLVVGDPSAIVVRAEFVFERYVEFDEPCVVVGDEDGSVVRLRFEQDGRVAVLVELEMGSLG
jgi:hypothetical protein